MKEYFYKEILDFFPYEPYKIQLDFMKIMYDMLKNTNIKQNENVKSFYNYFNENNVQQKLIKDKKNIFSLLDEYSNDKILEKENQNKINKYEHIICEMKTGSGKTMTLLSSFIYWLYKHEFDLFLIKEKIEIKEDEPNWIKENTIEKLLEKYENKLKRENEKKNNDENILKEYFSYNNEKIILNENTCIKKIKNIEFEKEKENLDNISLENNVDNISNYSIEDETQKKQIFICSRTQSQLNQYFEELRKIEKKLDKISINMILIGSRKHLCINDKFLQKYKNINELNDCCKSSQCKYKNVFNQMMVNKIKRNKKKTIFFESTDESETEDDELNNYNIVNKLINKKNLNINELKEICKNEKIEVCPYYLNKQNIKNADIILLPYICILNETVRKNLKINIKNNIVVFDESHNIIENINDSNSISIEYHNISFCKIILDEYIKKYKNILNNKNIILIKQLIIYCDLLLKYFNNNSDIINIIKFSIGSKIDILNINDISNFLNNFLFCRRIKIFAESFISKNVSYLKEKKIHGTLINTSSIYLLAEFTNKLIKSNNYDYVFLNKNNDNDEENLNEENINIKSIKNENENKNYNKNVNEDENIDENEKNIKKRNINKNIYLNNKKKKVEHEINGYNNFEELLNDILLKKKKLFYKLEIISISSCTNFQKIIKDCSNVILIGGTLYPLEEFLLLFLNENKNKIKFFSSDYIFKQTNVFSRIIDKNILNNELIDNTYKNRYNKIHLLNLLIQICILTLNVDYGNIVFFPSYNYLFIFEEFMKKEGNYILNIMKKKKYIFFEKKNDNTVLKEYIENLNLIKQHDENMRIKNGCVLFCVMNAKLSEGINFYDIFCRNIIIVGIPFAKYNTDNVYFDKNLILNYYKSYAKEIIVNNSNSLLIYDDINKMCLTYKLKHAMKIINQCIGRSLRHKNDFSSFFFLDYRFNQKEIYDNLPSFIKNSIENINKNKIVNNLDKEYIKIKENFYEIFNECKIYNKNNFSHLKLQQKNEEINNFINDLYMLNKFHEEMKKF